MDSPGDLIAFALALTDVRLSRGGDLLSSDAARIVAVLMLMPDPKVESAVDLAKRVGTYNQIDRSLQYQGDYSPKTLLRNDDLQFQKIREMEQSRFRHHVIVMIVSASLARAPEIWAWISRLLRYL